MSHGTWIKEGHSELSKFLGEDIVKCSVEAEEKEDLKISTREIVSKKLSEGKRSYKNF